MFILRCTFWLAVMYAAMWYGAGALRSPRAVEAAVADGAHAFGVSAVARATDWCAERPMRCARDAASLTALVETVAVDSRKDDVLADPPRRAAPLPVPDPRRHGERVVLTPSY